MNAVDAQPEPATPMPDRLQFSLRTLLLVFFTLATSLAVFGGGGLLVFAAVLGLAIAVRRGKLATWSDIDVWGLLGAICLLVLLMRAGISEARGKVSRSNCFSNYKLITMALLRYANATGHLPPAYIADKNGKPMHSWRVLILPYLGENKLYHAYDFSQPWNSPKNKQLLALRPVYYSCPSESTAGTLAAAQTSYMAVVGRKAAWQGVKPRKIDEIVGGTCNTVLLVESANSGIAWTEPHDFQLDSLATAGTPALTLSRNHGAEGFFFIDDRQADAILGMADGSARAVPASMLTAARLPEILEMGGLFEHDPEAYSRLPSNLPGRWNWPNLAAATVWPLSVVLLMAKALRGRQRPAQVSPPATSEPDILCI
jgi:hypothetical protein